MKKLATLCIIAALMTGVFLSGCGEKETQGSEQRLIYGSQDYTSINPALYEHGEINTLIFSGLTAHDADNHVIPALASSWEWDEGQLTYTFNLRTDLTFHDGEPLTSEDVKFTLEAILDEDNQSEIISNYTDIETITCPDAQTVLIKLRQPNVAFPDYMTIGILPKHLLDGEDLATCEFNRNPVGAGPYKLTSWDVGQSITMERFDDYYDGAAKIETVVFKIVPDSDARAIQLKAGDIDMAQITPKAAAEFEDSDKYQLYTMDTADYRAIAYNFNAPLFKENPTLANALSYAIDREAVLNSVLLGQGEAAYSPLQKNIYGSEDLNQFTYSPEKARQLLEADGWTMGDKGYYEKDGVELGFAICAQSDDKVRVDMAKICANQLQSIGVNAVAEAKPSLDWANQDSCIIGWGSPFDADDHTYKVFTTGAGDNYTAYSNSQVDKLLVKARKTVDEDQRKKLYGEFQKAMASAMPYSFIAYVNANYVVRNNISGITENTVLGHHGVGVFWNIAEWEIEK
ncbi:peptide/nickel transport system substrate-binding protein [Clostridiales Family XIII bacterium PM5-7]